MTLIELEASVLHHGDTEGTEDLIAFWRRCPLDGPVFCHPDDQAFLERKAKLVDAGGMDFSQFVESERFGNFSDRRMHLSLVPIPFMGNIQDADILLLLLNPGFEFADYWAETYSEEYRRRLKINLLQQHDGLAYPFVCLDPANCWHPGFGWWEKKLRAVVSIIATKWFGGRYICALQSIANRLAAIELIPYHSQSFNGQGLFDRDGNPTLPSAVAVRKFVVDNLVAAAERQEKTIIVTRKVKAWGLDDRVKSEYICTYSRGQARGASLSPNSPGGRAILRHYEKHPPRPLRDLCVSVVK